MPAARPAQWVHEGHRGLIGTDELGCQGASLIKPRMIRRTACRLDETPVQMQFGLELVRFGIEPCAAAGNDNCRFA
jgi:hypothetical protein